MNNIFKFVILFSVVLGLHSCEKDRGDDRIPLRDYQTQYLTDLADLEEYMKTHSYSVVNNPGMADDQDIIFEEVPEGDPNAIWNSPDLTFRTVLQHDIEYKLYFLKVREGGTGTENTYPCNVDAVLSSYRGTYLFHFTESTTVNGQTVTTDILKNKEFTYVPFPQTNINLEGAIKGWNEIFPQFRPGQVNAAPGQPTSYTDFGAGIMFIPSGLAYYGLNQSAIPAYSPLIFTFKLYEVSRLDQDQDGVPSWREDTDGDRYIRKQPDGSWSDDTDGDGSPDYLDLDDDGDHVLTKNEIKNPATQLPFAYADIPTCTGGTLKKHRDPACQ